MPALKAVIDTSVMVSVAFAKQGLAKELKDMIADEDFMLVTSNIFTVYKLSMSRHLLNQRSRIEVDSQPLNS